MVSKVGFKMFLNITPAVTNISADGREFSLVLEENPLAECVELPDQAVLEEFWYSNILCGVLRGSLEMVSFGSPVFFPFFRELDVFSTGQAISLLKSDALIECAHVGFDFFF